MDKVYRQDKRIFLSGLINTESAGDVIYHLLNINAEDDVKELSQVGYIREPVKFYIQSDGGSVPAAFGISDVIESSKTQIDTYGVGNILSAGVLIFLSGKNRFLYKNTEVMIHAANRHISGAMQDLIDKTASTLIIQERLETYIVAKTNIRLERLLEIRKTKENWHMFPEEALKFGICTAII